MTSGVSPPALAWARDHEFADARLLCARNPTPLLGFDLSRLVGCEVIEHIGDGVLKPQKAVRGEPLGRGGPSSCT